MGKRANASGSRLGCSTPSADRCGSGPWPGSVRSGNAWRTSSNCISIPSFVTYSARATIDAVRAFACPVCDSFAPFESRRCPTCQAELGLHVSSGSMIATSEGAAVIDGSRWIHCTKSGALGCNWLVPEAQDEARRGRGFADSLIRAEPHADDTLAQEKLADTTTAMH